MAPRSFRAVVDGPTRREVLIELESPTATAGDLLCELGLDGPNLQIDDGVIVTSEHELLDVEIRDGVCLAATDRAGRRPE